MNRMTTLSRFALAGLFVALAALAGCSKSENNKTNGKQESEMAAPQEGSQSKNIRLVYVEWSSCVAATDVVKAVLEDQGFNVTTTSVSAAAMYAAIADGDADAMVCAWLPSTQANYYAKTKDKLVNLGPNMVGTQLGLVVPDYVTIDSIPQLKDNASKFDDRIVGIDPGAGEMGLTQKVIKDYDLPLKLISGSGATMTAALKSAIDNHQWIVVTGWTPHWMWARWDLKYLKDPKGIYGTAENIDTLVREGLKKDMPKAYKILDAFNWKPADMQKVMAWNQEANANASEDAQRWVKENPKLVSSWLQ
ncbi:MAG: glycine betaine ABC transporter substrate-binding protein [Gammaproteobacteria bacterium]|jgi:glycine betaine/proline transport system substrate-binding protein